jgi:hypothetical protein
MLQTAAFGAKRMQMRVVGDIQLAGNHAFVFSCGMLIHGMGF